MFVRVYIKIELNPRRIDMTHCVISGAFKRFNEPLLVRALYTS